MKIQNWWFAGLLSLACAIPVVLRAAEPPQNKAQQLEQKLIQDKLQYDKLQKETQTPQGVANHAKKFELQKAAAQQAQAWRNLPVFGQDPQRQWLVPPMDSPRPDDRGVGQGRVQEQGQPMARGGRFNVTLLGFHVETQTEDDRLENDGRGDEVFLRCATLWHNREIARTSANIDLVTKTFGDVNRLSGRRIEAGRAGDRGGLRSGDSFPPLSPMLPAAGDPRNDRLPLQVFGGMLVAGRDVLVIAPTIHEWDDLGSPAPFFLAEGDVERPARPWHGGGENDRAGQLQTAIARSADRIGDMASRIDPPSLGERFLLAGRSLGFPTISGDMGGNRPIGMTRDGLDQLVFTPKALVLDYDTAELIAGSRFTMSVRGGGPDSRITLPPGVVPVRYLDDEGLNGDYTLFVLVERVTR